MRVLLASTGGRKPHFNQFFPTNESEGFQMCDADSLDMSSEKAMYAGIEREFPSELAADIEFEVGFSLPDGLRVDCSFTVHDPLEEGAVDVAREITALLGEYAKSLSPQPAINHGQGATNNRVRMSGQGYHPGNYGW